RGVSRIAGSSNDCKSRLAATLIFVPPMSATMYMLLSNALFKFSDHGRLGIRHIVLPCQIQRYPIGKKRSVERLFKASFPGERDALHGNPPLAEHFCGNAHTLLNARVIS